MVLHTYWGDVNFTVSVFSLYDESGRYAGYFRELNREPLALYFHDPEDFLRVEFDFPFEPEKKFRKGFIFKRELEWGIEIASVGYNSTKFLPSWIAAFRAGGPDNYYFFVSDSSPQNGFLYPGEYQVSLKIGDRTYSLFKFRVEGFGVLPPGWLPFEEGRRKYFPLFVGVSYPSGGTFYLPADVKGSALVINSFGNPFDFLLPEGSLKHRYFSFILWYQRGALGEILKHEMKHLNCYESFYYRGRKIRRRCRTLKILYAIKDGYLKLQIRLRRALGRSFFYEFYLSGRPGVRLFRVHVLHGFSKMGRVYPLRKVEAGRVYLTMRPAILDGGEEVELEPLFSFFTAGGRTAYYGYPGTTARLAYIFKRSGKNFRYVRVSIRRLPGVYPGDFSPLVFLVEIRGVRYLTYMRAAYRGEKLKRLMEKGPACADRVLSPKWYPFRNLPFMRDKNMRDKNMRGKNMRDKVFSRKEGTYWFGFSLIPLSPSRPVVKPEGFLLSGGRSLKYYLRYRYSLLKYLRLSFMNSNVSMNPNVKESEFARWASVFINVPYWLLHYHLTVRFPRALKAKIWENAFFGVDCSALVWAAGLASGEEFFRERNYPCTSLDYRKFLGVKNYGWQKWLKKHLRDKDAYMGTHFAHSTRGNGFFISTDNDIDDDSCEDVVFGDTPVEWLSNFEASIKVRLSSGDLLFVDLLSDSAGRSVDHVGIYSKIFYSRYGFFTADSVIHASATTFGYVVRDPSPLRSLFWSGASPAVIFKGVAAFPKALATASSFN